MQTILVFSSPFARKTIFCISPTSILPKSLVLVFVAVAVKYMHWCFTAQRNTVRRGFVVGAMVFSRSQYQLVVEFRSYFPYIFILLTRHRLTILNRTRISLTSTPHTNFTCLCLHILFMGLFCLDRTCFNQISWMICTFPLEQQPIVYPSIIFLKSNNITLHPTLRTRIPIF